MRIVVTGASGNVGSRVLDLLAQGSHAVTGLARRPPESGPLAAQATWVACDLSRPEAHRVLDDVVAGADAVIHLAWLIQPGHDEPALRATNVDGTRRLLEALRRRGQRDGRAPALIVASSVGAYAPGPKSPPVTEDWPTTGVRTSSYSRQKVAVEQLLDDYEQGGVGRVVRIRPGVVFSARAASSQARYFLGPLLPMTLLRRELIPAVPAPPRLVAAMVHSADVAAAFVAAAEQESATGAYNVAADDPLTGRLLAELLHALPVPVPEVVLRLAADVSWRLRLQPTDVGWVDMALQLPLMSTERIRRELGWAPRHSASETLDEWLRGMRRREGGPSPVLRPSQGAAHQAQAAAPTSRSDDERPI